MGKNALPDGGGGGMGVGRAGRPARSRGPSHSKIPTESVSRVGRTRRHLDNERRWRAAHPVRRLIVQARKRAKVQNAQMDLKEGDLVVPKKCPILGIPLIWEGGQGQQDGSPSIDRIVPEKGYTADNVWIISWRANRIKNNATVEELELIAEALRIVGD